MSILKTVLEGLSEDQQEELYQKHKSNMAKGIGIGAGIGAGYNMATGSGYRTLKGKGMAMDAAAGAGLGAMGGGAATRASNDGLKAGLAGRKTNMSAEKGALLGAGIGILAGHPFLGAGIGAYAGHRYAQANQKGLELRKKKEQELVAAQ